MKEPIQKATYQGGYYHIYNRGNRKQDLFLEEIDYIGYLERLRKCKEKHKISVICYCLMPNHIHLLLRQDSENPLYKFIQSLHTSYSMYFNRKYDKVGHLFQGRFKQKELDKDEYLLQLSSYIHLNPLIDGLVEKLEDYQWSSYPDYIDLRQGTLCEKDLVLLDKSPEEYKQITEQEIKEKLLMKDILFEVVP
jgi:REP element-mobilizing transposase RayT